MKNLAKLNGAKALSKKEQKSINGGNPLSCQSSGGEWTCVGTSNCGCLYGIYDNSESYLK